MKYNILYAITVLAFLVSFKETKEELAKEITPQKQISEKAKQAQPEKAIPELYLFPEVSSANFAKVDSTNFDNFKEKNKLTDAQIEKLHLKKVNPNAENFYTRYKLSFSKDFETLAVTATSEMEMTTYLINYKQDYSIIDFLPIAYDEIAQNWMWTTSKIDKNRIKIEEHNEAGGEDEVTKETYVIKSGKFIKKKYIRI